MRIQLSVISYQYVVGQQNTDYGLLTTRSEARLSC